MKSKAVPENYNRVSPHVENHTCSLFTLSFSPSLFHPPSLPSTPFSLSLCLSYVPFSLFFSCNSKVKRITCFYSAACVLWRTHVHSRVCVREWAVLSGGQKHSQGTRLPRPLLFPSICCFFSHWRRMWKRIIRVCRFVLYVNMKHPSNPAVEPESVIQSLRSAIVQATREASLINQAFLRDSK